MKSKKREEMEESKEHEMKEDCGFYGHMTHGSVQSNEDSVKVIGSQPDADFPKSPKTDTFYKGNTNCLL